MFLTTNDRIINLKNVSNINILKDRFRIVFNLNYNIDINNTGKTKLISDYVYWDAIDDTNLKANLKHLIDNSYFGETFISQPNNLVFININEISSIKFSEKKNRVIFNLSHPITFKDNDGNERITSEFVYVNCDNYQQYKEYVKYVKLTLGE